MSKNVWFCETAQQVSQAVTSVPLSEASDVYMALTPEAAWECQERSIPYLKLEDFYDERDLCNCSYTVLALEAQWAEWVDEFLQASFPEFRQQDFRPAHLHLYFLKVFFDELFIRTYMLRHFLENYQPEQVCYFAPQKSSPTWDLFFRESPYSLILPALAKRYGVQTRALETRHRSQREKPKELRGREVAQIEPHFALTILHRRIAHFLPVSWMDEIRLYRQLGLAEYVESFKRRVSPSRTVLVLHRGHDVRPVIARLRGLGVRVELWHKELWLDNNASWQFGELENDLHRLWDTVVREDGFRRPYAEWGVELEEIVKSRLSVWWSKVIPEAWNAFVQALGGLSTGRYAAVLTPYTWGHEESAVLMAAKSLDIPRVIYQHGGWVGSSELVMWDFMDIFEADYLLVYGDGVREYVEERARCYDEPRARPISVGSARLDHIRSHLRPGYIRSLKRKLSGPDRRPIILYVPTAFMGYNRYLCCDAYPDVFYFELQQQVVGLFCEFPEIKLVYKEFFGTDRLFNPIPDIIHQDIPNGLVIRHIPLTDLIWAVDGIIMDFPSTGLQEALMTGKPIVVYADKRSLRMRPEAKTLLRKRALLTETPDDFVEQIRGFLRAGDFSDLPSPNDEFLRVYATHLNDGRSAERAVDALMRILNRT